MQLREQLIDKLNLNAFKYPAPGGELLSALFFGRRRIFAGEGFWLEFFLFAGVGFWPGGVFAKGGY